MEQWLLLAARVFAKHLSCHLALAAIAAALPVGARTALADRAASAEIDPILGKANRALAEGRYASARRLYRSVLARDPDDPTALREGGRAAHVLGDFAAAVALLQKAAAVVKAPDPELHYLLAEALWVLGRKSEARAEYSLAKREIGAAPTERLPRLWLARIADRLGDRQAACAIYDALSVADPSDAEAALTHAEMHASASDWSGAEAQLRRFLAVQPGHRRALEMLAWITEAQGRLHVELELREELARDSRTAAPVRDYGRALERAGDWAGALEMYSRAKGLAGGSGDPMLERALERVAQRMSIEIAAGASARTDTGASSLGASTGIAVPFGRAHHIALGAWQERVSSGPREGSTSELFGAIVLNGPRSRIAAGAELGIIDFSSGAGEGSKPRTHTAPAAFMELRRSLLGKHVELGLDGEWNGLWRETPLVLLEGGRADSVTGHAWVNAFGHRLVIDTGVQARRLRFLEMDSGAPRASQLLAWAGADWQLWGDAKKQAAGQILDSELLRPTFLASSVVGSYRHYEAFGTTNMAFADRLVLAERASIDEASLAVRLAVREGKLAFQGRGGLGRDWARRLWIASGDISLWIATGSSSRLVLDLDVATESDFAMSGKRMAGGMSYHVDL